jgi:phosphoglycolate phosphatase-like HAD superfamily hydrolase
MDRWGVERLVGDRLQRFRDCFDEDFWSALPAVAGALEACQNLHAAGYELVCVSALESRYGAARLVNLRALGFPIDRVIATGSTAGDESPKATALRSLAPVAFVDDYLPYFRGVPADVHRALVLRQPTGSPNTGAGLDAINSKHVDLAAFAAWWLARA